MMNEPDRRREHAERARVLVVFVALCALVVVLVLGIVLAAAAFGAERRHYAPGSSSARFTEATQNVRYTNTARAISRDVRASMRRASVVRLQEVYSPSARVGVRRALASRPHWRAYPANLRAAGGADVIIWSSRRWRAVPAPHNFGARRLTSGIAHLTPSRYVVWVTLARAVGNTRRVVTFANTHAVSGYCKRATRPELRDRIAAQHWVQLARWTRVQRARHPQRSILLGGDFNCSPWQRGAGTPGQYLRSLYVLDSPRRGYDRLLSLNVPGRPRVLDRWSLPARSDHRLHLRTLALPRL